MTEQEQVKFVEELSQNVTREIIKIIEEGKTPETWDGVELRQLLADRFSQVVWSPMERRRKREYNNTKLVNNL